VITHDALIDNQEWYREDEGRSELLKQSVNSVLRLRGFDNYDDCGLFGFSSSVRASQTAVLLGAFAEGTLYSQRNPFGNLVRVSAKLGSCTPTRQMLRLLAIFSVLQVPLRSSFRMELQSSRTVTASDVYFDLSMSARSSARSLAGRCAIFLFRVVLVSIFRVLFFV